MSGMKGADRLRAQLGDNIRESMSTVTTGATGPLPPASAPVQFQGVTRPKDALTIEVGRIVPDPDQPRKAFDPEALEDLAASLKARGQLQPIRVRWSAELGSWVIVSGERRWRAARMAGLATLACVEAKGTPTPDEILEDQLVENCIREDLKPIEQAHAFRALIERRGCSYRQLAESLKISHMKVSRALELLALPEPVQADIERGALAPSVACEVAKLDDPKTQTEVAARVVAENLSRAETVEVVRQAAERSARPRTGAKGRGVTKAGPPRPKVFRSALGRVTVELKRPGDAEAIRAMLVDAMGQLDAAATKDDQAAA